MKQWRMMAALALALGSLSCASAKLNHVWQAPNLSQQPISRSLVISLASSETVRRAFEEAMVAQLREHRLDAIASYTLIGDREDLSRERVKETLAQHGFDSVFIARLLDAKEEVQWVPADPWTYRDFWGFYSYAWASPLARGRFQTRQVVQWETRLYSTQPESNLIWSTISSSFDPPSLQKQVQGVAEAVAERVTKDVRISQAPTSAPPAPPTAPAAPEAPLPAASPSSPKAPAPVEPPSPAPAG